MANVSAMRSLAEQESRELSEQLDQLKAKYGADRVKVEAKRRPKPKDPGRPKVWDHIELFTLWLIVQTFLQDEPKVEKVCRLLAKDLPHIFASANRVRRLFYDAEAEFDNYEVRNADVTTKVREDDFRTLKERLFGYAEVLRECEIISFQMSFAVKIVIYELQLDGTYSCPCGRVHPPPLHPPELSWASQVREVRNRKRNAV